MSRTVVDLDAPVSTEAVGGAGACPPLHADGADLHSTDVAGLLDPAEPARQRVRHLFRHSLRDGEVNPLLHMLLRYRTGGTP